ncbi:MAG: ABC transporter permease [Firmicutes bacterium]|jgi:peptide/nickel transport system permease protein|nr:ABC transporter permease [Bacillota bacterium]
MKKVIGMRNFKDHYLDYFITFIILLFLSFYLPRLIPGSPIDAILGGGEGVVNITDELRREVSIRYGLDKPLYQQFIIYVGNIIKLDFGYSYVYSRPVIEIILASLPWTLLLVVFSVFLSTTIGVLLGIESAYRYKKKFDKFSVGLLMSSSGFPQFFIGILLLILFGINLGWLPISGGKSPFNDFDGVYYIIDVARHLILPMLTIVITEVSGVFMLARSSAIMVIQKPYYFMAKAKGLSKYTIKYSYIGRNILLPVVNHIGMRLGKVLVGELMVEVVFSYPGLGSLLYNSVSSRDYPVIQGLFVLVAIMTLITSSVTEHFNRHVESRQGGS